MYTNSLCTGLYYTLHCTTGVSLTDYLKATDPTSIPPECVVRYASYWKSKYLEMCIFPDDWPPEVSTDQKYTKLALIRQNYSKAKSSTMEHDYIHGHIDNIVAVKESIDIHEVFYPIINKTTGESRLTILMDGAPGVGKTTITRKLCQDWAKGKVLQEYHLVILIPVRFVELDKDSKISKLFPSESDDMTDQVTSYYVSNMGKRILFILDGYDEANEQSKTEQSLLTQLIFGQKLWNCSMLVTSRPYASGYLKSHPRINRYVEVLGFSKKQIKKCIQQNTDQAERLIQMLKERLDIVSLCYIPLNCRIVLFVYKYLDFKLPETLTELYETFILHTIKHHEEKRQSAHARKVKIHAAKNLAELSLGFTDKLKSLCELAYNGIQQGKLSFSEEELKLESLLSLGLLNSYENLTLVNVQKHFQFLHLTIQEFLAAKHLVTWSNCKLIDFVRSSITNVKFRMVVLFVAGLTKLQFVPHGESLATLEHLLADPSTADREAGRQRQQLIIFFAQMFYESQLPATSTLFLIESNKLDFSGHRLSQFEDLVIAHFLSSTAEDHRWEEINLGNSDITHIIDKKHRIHSKQLSLSMTNSLLVREVDIKCMFPVLKQGIKELHLASQEIDHKNFAKLCQLIATHDHIQKVIFYTAFFSKESTELSRECIHVPKSIFVCSFSFAYLLQFLSKNKPVSIICPDQEHILTKCSECRHSGKETCKKLIAKIAGDEPINCLNLSRCNLSSNTINSLVDNVLNRPVDSIIEELDIDGNDLTTLPMEKLVLLLTRGTSLKAHGFNFQPEKNFLQITDCNEDYKKHTYMVKNFNAPDCFSSVEIDFTIRNIPIWFVTYILVRNQNIHNLKMNYGSFCIERTCEESLSLAKTIKSHKSLECLTLPQLVITRNTLSINKDKLYDLLTKVCTNALGTLLDFLNEKPETLHMNNLPNAFQDCGNCQVAASRTINKLFKLIANNNKLLNFSTFNCRLSEKQTRLIAMLIPTSICSVNLTGNAFSTEKINEVFALAQLNLLELHIDGFTFEVKVGNTSSVCIQCNGSHEPQCHGLFSTLTFPPKLKLVKISNTVKFNLASIVCSILRNNPQIEDITLGSVETPLACGEVISVAESLNKHTSLQRLYFWKEIARNALSLRGLKLCPMSLQRLLMFLDPEQTVRINLADEHTAFQDCQHCGASTVGVVSTFFGILDQVKNLKSLDVTNCQLPAGLIDSLVTKLLDLSLLEFVSLKDNTVDEQSFIHLLRLFSNLNFQELQLTDITLCNKSSHYFTSWDLSFQDSHQLCCFINAMDSKTYYLLHFLESMVNVPLRHKGVHISGAELTSDHAALMEKLICEHETVCSFSLDSCRLTSESASTLLKSIKVTQNIKGLSLNRTDCSKLLFQILNAISVSTIEEFQFSLTNDEDKVDSEELGKSLSALFEHSKCLQILTLSNCNLTIFNYISIGIAANSTLHSLYYHCFQEPESYDESVPRLQDEESKKLCKSIDLTLASHSLKSLNLVHFYCDEMVMSHLATGLTMNKNIQILALRSLMLPYHGHRIWTTLFRALERNTILHTLDISGNNLEEEGLSSLADSLYINKSIATLEVDDIPEDPYEQYYDCPWYDQYIDQYTDYRKILQANLAPGGQLHFFSTFR